MLAKASGWLVRLICMQPTSIDCVTRGRIDVAAATAWALLS